MTQETSIHTTTHKWIENCDIYYKEQQKIYQSIHHFVLLVKSKVFAKSDGEPEENLSDRDKADSKAEAADAAKAGDEVEPGHLGGSLKLCKFTLRCR